MNSPKDYLTDRVEKKHKCVFNSATNKCKLCGVKWEDRVQPEPIQRDCSCPPHGHFTSCYIEKMAKPPQIIEYEKGTKFKIKYPHEKTKEKQGDKQKKVYKIIYADPPWKYKDKSKSHGGGAESHYPCMSINEICSLPINEIGEDNSVLLMWVTMPMLEEAFKVINKWGFKYKTCAFTWVKINKDKSIYMGMGRHTRANAEICLLSTKGNGIKRINAGIKNTHLFERKKHSEKPNQFRNLIVDLYGNLPRVELFARQKTEGWDVWGNEVTSDINI